MFKIHFTSPLFRPLHNNRRWRNIHPLYPVPLSLPQMWSLDYVQVPMASSSSEASPDSTTSERSLPERLSVAPGQRRSSKADEIVRKMSLVSGELSPQGESTNQRRGRRVRGPMRGGEGGLVDQSEAREVYGQSETERESGGPIRDREGVW